MSPVTETARGALADAIIHREWVAAYRTPEAQKFYETAFDELLYEADVQPGATQFTELYVLAPWRWLRQRVHAFSDVWFRFVRLPRGAFANILTFEKPA